MANVLSINGINPARSPGQRILVECRDELAHHLSAWLREVAGPISEELFVLADSTRERLLQTRYLDLRADIEKDWTHLVEAFRRNLSSEMERCQTGNAANSVTREMPLEVPDFEGLTLVDDGDLSEHIVVREFSAQIAETCDEELYTLNRRVAALLGHDDQVDSGNPLAPRIICQALSDACAAIGGDAETRLLLLRRLERHLHGGLPPIYRQINASLIKRGILPDLRRSFRKSDIFGEARSAVAKNVTGAGNNGAIAPLTATNTATTAPVDGNILETLQRLAQARTAGPWPALVGNAATGDIQTAATPGAATMSPAVSAVASHGENQPSTATSIDLGALNALLLASLGEMQRATPPVTLGTTPIVNQIRLVRESEDARQVGGMAAVTIDIVAMLFDFIFDDEHIPLAVKALLSRLQIPVLKVAMLNPGFFADRQHPTRRFLGSVSGISIRWGSAVNESDPFYGKLAEQVGRIQAEFENDIEIFGTALDELEAFVKKNEQTEDSDTLPATRIILQREREAAALEHACRTTRDFCALALLPPVVSAFLDEHWSSVLQEAELGDDTGGIWQSAEQTMRDLAWSIEPKKSPDDRLKLISLLPKLLGQINRGLDSIQLEPAQRQRFFDELVKHHSAALKGERRPAPPENTEAPASIETFEFTPPSDGTLQVTLSQSDGIEVEEITLIDASPVWRADDREIFRRVSELSRGDWIEFRESGDDGSPVTYRERLHWISPQRGILLFSNHRSASAISITPEALARQIRDGQASIVAPEEIFEKALTGALASINAPEANGSQA